MKIKQLEIRGFKSFPDKTVLEFKSGITSVVGPNGCGKSNILEAIRWAMGEQRAKILRGGKMEDVIFNGSESRKAVGMAEVRLVLENDDGLAPASMADYDEIMITRRLFRDGDSQYEINNVPCRLSDITDFFLDTGVGRNSYAIIEQGRVDMVVASKPEDRRILIEEAAGISRYKSRKEAALKKLEQTRQNLQRIGDVVNEVKRQHAALKRQAAKAERYRKLSDCLREMDLASHSFLCSGIQERSGLLRAEIEKDHSVLLRQESGLRIREADLEKSRVGALETEKALKEILEARHKTDIDLTTVRGRIERDRARVSRIDEDLGRATRERVAVESRKDEVGLKLADTDKHLAAVRGDLEAARNQLGRCLDSVQGHDRALALKRKEQDSLKDETFLLLNKTAQERNRQEDLKKRAKEIESSLARIAQESLTTASTMEKDKSERDRLRSELAQTVDLRQRTLSDKDRLASERKDLIKEADAFRSEKTRLEKLAAADRGRLESLEEMHANFVGYDRGVRFLMANRESAKEDAIFGPVAEMIEVPQKYQKALAAALGERLSHLVVASPRDGLEAAKRLKEAEAGRSTFIPVCPRCEPGSGNCETLKGPQRLKEVIRFKEGLEGLGDFLLGRCFVVEDAQQALEIWEANGIHVDLVTLDGEVISRHGEITGGSRDKAKEEVFEKRREIAALRQQLQSNEQTASRLASSLNNLETRLTEFDSQIEHVERLLNDLNLKEVRLKKDLEQIAPQIPASVRKLEVLSLEKERLEKESLNLSARAAQCRQEIAMLETGLADLENRKKVTSQEVEELSEVVRKNSSEVGEFRAKLAQLEERSRSLEREHSAMADNLRALETQISGLAEQMATNSAEKEKLTQNLAQAVVREQELMREHESQQNSIEVLEARSVELAESVKVLEKETSAASKAVQSLRENLHAREMDLVKLDQTLEGLVERVLDRYGVDPSTVPCPDSPPEEGELDEARAKLEALGEVNLAAIAESRQIDERLVFLVEQEADLKQAVDSLYATINKINKTTREKFRAAFDSVNEKFQEMFPFLFRGGEARLVLTDEEDLLETGVDIMARPPGKRIQNMTLLSGGEKALTAVGLIFSIFLTRPSPFCLLDEVDAPLDDANLTRFNEMLRELSARVQFLIITHNKRSMEEADSLYGVTMEEPGVSRVVSVEFMD